MLLFRALPSALTPARAQCGVVALAPLELDPAWLPALEAGAGSVTIALTPVIAEPGPAAAVGALPPGSKPLLTLKPAAFARGLARGANAGWGAARLLSCDEVPAAWLMPAVQAHRRRQVTADDAALCIVVEAEGECAEILARMLSASAMRVHVAFTSERDPSMELY